MKQQGLDPITVESPARFAVLGAGTPAPRVLAASSDSVSDLIGYFSLREAGLDMIVEGAYQFEPYRPSNILFSAFTSNDKVKPVDRYLAIDAYVRPPGEERAKLYSLIIDRSGIPHAKLAALDEFSEKVGEQVARLALSFESGNEDEAVYVSQMLATLVAFLLDRIDRESRLIDRKHELYRMAFTAYVAAFGIFTSLAMIIGEDKLIGRIKSIFNFGQ